MAQSRKQRLRRKIKKWLRRRGMKVWFRARPRTAVKPRDY